MAHLPLPSPFCNTPAPASALQSDDLWMQYVRYVNGLVRQGILQALEHSLSNLRNQVSGSSAYRPPPLPFREP